MNLIDVHTHISSHAFMDLLASQGGNVYGRARDAEGREVVTRNGARFMTLTEPMFDPAARAETEDAAGLKIGLLSYTCPNCYWAEGELAETLPRMMNDHLAEVCANSGGRYRGLASIPLQDTDLALAELERAVDQLGMVGVIILANVNGVPLDDPRFEPVWNELNRRRLPTLMHPTVPPGDADMRIGDYGMIAALGFMIDTTLATLRMTLGGVFERNPDWPLVISHAGATLPFLVGRFDQCHRLIPDVRAHTPHPPSHYLGRLYYDTVCYETNALKLAYDLAGPERLIYGSDFPHNIGDMQGCADRISQLDIPEAEKELIRHGNAERIFKL